MSRSRPWQLSLSRFFRAKFLPSVSAPLLQLGCPAICQDSTKLLTQSENEHLFSPLCLHPPNADDATATLHVTSKCTHAESAHNQPTYCVYLAVPISRNIRACKNLLTPCTNCPSLTKTCVFTFIGLTCENKNKQTNKKHFLLSSIKNLIARSQQLCPT